MNYDDQHTLALMEKYSKPKNVTKTKNTKPNVKLSTASKITPKVRKRSSPKRSNIRLLLIKVVAGFIGLMLLFLGGRYLYDQTINYNPLLGTWRAQTIMGIMEISFERKHMLQFGSQKAVTYDVQDKQVIVMDEDIKIGESYRIIDENTIAVQAGSSKTTFKRVK